MSSYSPARLHRDLHQIVRFLIKQRIPYLLIGGLALSFWGRPRMTLDLDFLIEIDEAGLEKLGILAKRERFRTDTEWLKWNPLLKGSQIRLEIGRLPVDLMAPRDNQDRAALKRARHRKLGRRYYRVISPEDFVLQKLKVGRQRDFEDAVTVLERMRGKLDLVYLRMWARKLGILEELNYILSL